MESREQRIATLATTLRSSGIAKSDSQAKMMAEDMIGVEEHVQRDYEVEHTRAHEYLQTTKNLGTPRQTQTARQDSNIDVKQESSKQNFSRQESPKQEPSKFEELYTSGVSSSSKREPVSGHDTHNPALEAIKAQISQTSQEQIVDREPIREEFKPVDDIISAPISNDADSIFHKDVEVVPVDAPKETISPLTESIDTLESIDAPEAPKIAEVKEVPVVETTKEISQEKSIDEPKLDAKRLLDLMEEDGKLEEHTREIKEKPKDVKPKEAYEENNIDLGSMFDFNKGTIRK